MTPNPRRPLPAIPANLAGRAHANPATGWMVGTDYPADALPAERVVHFAAVVAARGILVTPQR